MTLPLTEIKSGVKKLAKIIAAPAETLPTFGHSEQSGRPHVEVDSKGYHFVLAERGQEMERQITSDIDKLLYLIFQWITFELAIKADCFCFGGAILNPMTARIPASFLLKDKERSIVSVNGGTAAEEGHIQPWRTDMDRIHLQLPLQVLL